MLVLSRKQNESVVLTSPGGEGLITITVVAIRGGRVRLGFEAGDDVPSYRPEVWEQNRVNGQHTDRPQTRDAAATTAMDRWEDDGGGGLQAEGSTTAPEVIGRL